MSSNSNVECREYVYLSERMRIRKKEGRGKKNLNQQLKPRKIFESSYKRERSGRKAENKGRRQYKDINKICRNSQKKSRKS